MFPPRMGNQVQGAGCVQLGKCSNQLLIPLIEGLVPDQVIQVEDLCTWHHRGQGGGEGGLA